MRLVETERERGRGREREGGRERDGEREGRAGAAGRPPRLAHRGEGDNGVVHRPAAAQRIRVIGPGCPRCEADAVDEAGRDRLPRKRKSQEERNLSELRGGKESRRWNLRGQEARAVPKAQMASSGPQRGPAPLTRCTSKRGGRRRPRALSRTAAASSRADSLHQRTRTPRCLPPASCCLTARCREGGLFRFAAVRLCGCAPRNPD